jgi:2-phospho-L-lactate guanylyltransferase
MAVKGLDRVVVASSDPETLLLAAAAKATPLREHEQLGHSQAVEQATQQLIKWGATSLLLLPIDVPCVRTAEIEELLVAANGLIAPSLVIVPNGEGSGTNAMVRTPPDLISSRFGPNSLPQHLEQARAAKARILILNPPGLVHDVDTPEEARDLMTRGWSGRSAGLFRKFLARHA